MAIANIASYHQYDSTPTTVMSQATVPHPSFLRVRPFWAGTLGYFTGQVVKPPVVIDPEQRPWFRFSPNSNHSSSTTYGCITLASNAIDDDLKEAGTTIIFGFKFATGTASAGGNFIGVREPSTTAISETTRLTAVAGTQITANQYRWVDFVVKYKADNVCEVFVYVDKEQVHTFTTTHTTLWAVGAGTFARSIINATNYNQGFYVNDFITVIDKDTDEEKTGDVGPVTILSLEPKTPQHNAMWTPSPGKTMRESLSNKMTESVTMFPDAELIRSDPYGTEMITGFRAPLVEDRKMLAFQQFFVAQKPMSMGANLHYRPTLNGVPQGDKQLYETGISTDAFHVYMPPVQLPEDQTQARSIIESHGMAFSSSKKVIPL